MVTSPLAPAPDRRRVRALFRHFGQNAVSLGAPAPLRLWHLTSLDAPTVAVVWTLAFGWCAGIRLPLWTPVLLGLAAWTAYIADRLMDVMGARRERSDGRQRKARLRARHHFHWKHRRIFLPLAVVSGAAAAVIAFHFMPLAIRERDSVLAAAALAYFTSVHHPWRRAAEDDGHRTRRGMRIPKELLVGCIFTAACAAPAWYRMPAHRAILIIPALFFVALAWLNCHAIEIWESETKRPSARSISWMGASLSAAALSVGALLAAVAAASLNGSLSIHEAVGLRGAIWLHGATYGLRPALLLCAAACSGLLLALLDRIRDRLSALALRTAADLVLLTPLALLWLR